MDAPQTAKERINPVIVAPGKARGLFACELFFFFFGLF
jgi:hypothetical protein